MTQQEAVEDRPRGIIEVGDEIRAVGGYTMRVTHVERGSLGILWECFIPELGEDESDSGRHHGYLPSELPPSDDSPKWGWHGWANYGSLVLCSGAVVGYVCFYERDARPSLEEHEAEWLKTIESMDKEPEPMQSRPTAYRLD